MKGQIVHANEVKAGDHVILPALGSRPVVDVDEYDEDTGPRAGPRLRIIYGLGASQAFENRASSAKGPRAIAQPTAGTRPFRPDEPIAIERRAV